MGEKWEKKGEKNGRKMGRKMRRKMGGEIDERREGRGWRDTLVMSKD